MSAGVASKLAQDFSNFNNTLLKKEENIWDPDYESAGEDYPWSQYKGTRSRYMTLMLLVGLGALVGALLAGIGSRRYIHQMAPFMIGLLTTAVLLIMKDNFDSSVNVYE